MIDSGLSIFLEESRELLTEMEQAALRLEEDPGNSEAINAMFRAAHTIKGSAGLFGLDDIVSFTHVVENVMDRVRNGQLAVSNNLMAAVLRCGDHMGALIGAVAQHGQKPLPADLLSRGHELLAHLTTVAGQPAGSKPNHTPSQSASSDSGQTMSADGKGVENRHFHISLRFSKDVLRSGMDPASFLTFLGKIGEVVRVVTVLDHIPAASEMDPESNYLGFEVAFKSNATIATIEGVFEFVRDDLKLHIIPPGSPLDEYGKLISSLPEGPQRASELVQLCGTLTAEESARLAAKETTPAPPTQPTAIATPDPTPPSQPTPAAQNAEAPKDPGKDGKASSEQGKSVRVDAEKLDRLIDLVGELVIAGAGTSVQAQRVCDAQLTESTEAMTRLVDEIRESALRLRMVQIGETFSRFRRVVRDVSQKLGKDIELAISGGDTELDKAVVEKMTDPLTHMVRNAMDHGIEPADVRTAAGKPCQGTLRLHAYHDSGNVVIEIADDGCGINRARVLKKARDRGLIRPDQELTDDETLKLIFQPGLSTAEQVTDLSGRGVGMDVVRSNIEALRGSVEIESTEGQGTTLRVRIPLTLAIIDGFLVRIAKRPYVVPLDAVVECIELPEETNSRGNGRRYLNLRGEVLPYVVVKELFAAGGGVFAASIPEVKDKDSHGNVVVVQSGSKKAGLVVDELAGEVQTVIKPMGKLFQSLRWISGSSVLGSGEVALILDVQALLQYTTESEVRQVARRSATEQRAHGR